MEVPTGQFQALCADVAAIKKAIGEMKMEYDVQRAFYEAGRSDEAKDSYARAARQSRRGREPRGERPGHLAAVDGGAS